MHKTKQIFRFIIHLNNWLTGIYQKQLSEKPLQNSQH